MSRRDQITMTDAETRAFLEAGRDLQVASINADGTPHLVTMWYELDGGDICFWTYGKSQKVVNLRRDPRLTRARRDGRGLRGAAGRLDRRARGDRRARHARGARVRAASCSRSTGAPRTTSSCRAGVEAQAQKRVVIRVKADNTVTWDHSKLAGAY